MRVYKVAPMDLVVGFATGYCAALTIFFVVYGAAYTKLGTLALGALLLAALWASWQYSPKRYVLTEDALVIVRGQPFGDISIPLKEIGDVRRYDPYAYGFTLNRFYTGTVLFSSSGWSMSARIGHYYRAFTNSKRAVLITAKKGYVISPAHPDEFIADMQRVIAPTPQ